MSRQRSLEQERAKMAWECVGKVKGQSFAKEYCQVARSAPADILTNGLGQTLAFFRAKGYQNGEPKNKGANAHYQLLDHASQWIRSQLMLGERRDIVEWISEEASTNEYRRATSETIAFLSWLKRFAEAELGGE